MCKIQSHMQKQKKWETGRACNPSQLPLDIFVTILVQTFKTTRINTFRQHFTDLFPVQPNTKLNFTLLTAPYSENVFLREHPTLFNTGMDVLWVFWWEKGYRCPSYFGQEYSSLNSYHTSSNFLLLNVLVSSNGGVGSNPTCDSKFGFACGQ